MKIELFANLTSGRGRGRAIAQPLLTRLQNEKFDASLCLAHPDTLGSFPRADILVVIGGDGTLRTVLDRARREMIPLSPTLFIPLGTANLMARHLGMEWRRKSIAENALKLITQRKIRDVDAAECNGRLFLLMSSVGFDASIVHRLARTRSGPISICSYIAPTFNALWTYRQPPMRIRVDGEQVIDNRRCFIYVGNVSEYGPGFSLAPHARSDDGLLDVCIFPSENTLDLVNLSLTSLTRGSNEVGGSIFRRGREILIESDQPVPVQVDGDPAGFTPVQIRLLPWRVPFIVA